MSDLKSINMKLVFAFLVFVIIFTIISYLRYLNFYTTTWDMGIPMQMLSSVANGKLLFETPDLTFYGVYSFLEVHSTYIAVPISYVYYLVPRPITLFVIQSVMLGAVIFPLYAIGKHYDVPEWIIFTTFLLFCTNYFVLSGAMYDFHWESFIPFEFLMVYLFLLKHKILPAAIMMILGDMTLEVFPFLSMGIILYFLLESFGRRILSPREICGDRNLQKLLALFLLSAIVYLLIREVQYIILPAYVGSTVNLGTVSVAVTNLFTPSFSHTIPLVLVYWLLLFGSFAMLPLLKPRMLVMSTPWIFFTFVRGNGYASVGFQYSLIAIAPLVIVVMLGMWKLFYGNEETEIKRPAINALILICSVVIMVLTLTYSHSILAIGSFANILFLVLSLFYFLSVIFLIKRDPVNLNVGGKIRAFFMKERLAKYSTFILIFVIVFSSLSLSPLNPQNFQATSSPGYSFSYGVNGEFSQVTSLVGEIPNNAVILASNNLFPLVANDINAYSIAWFPYSLYNSTVPYFPFNQSNLPQYVLIDTADLQLVPPFILNSIQNKSDYQMLGYVQSSAYPGSIYLYERSVI